MNTDLQKRILLKGAIAASALGAVVGAGLLTPRMVVAAWPEAAFAAKNLSDSLKALAGSDQMTESGDIKIKAPDIAENGAVVPITVSTTIPKIESIAVVAANNPFPLIANFRLGEGAEGYISTRAKMGTSGDVIAVVKADGKLHSTKKTCKGNDWRMWWLSKKFSEDLKRYKPWQKNQLRFVPKSRTI